MSVTRFAVLVALGVLVGLAAARGVAEETTTFDGAATIRIGGSATAAFAGFDGEVHQYSFVAQEGSVLSASVAPGGAKTLKPLLRLTSPGGTRVGVGPAQTGDATIRNFRFPYSGDFVLEVSAKSGTGSYTLSTGGRLAKGLHGIARRQSGAETWAFFVQDGTTVSVTASPRGAASGGTQVRITGLTDPAQNAVTITPQQAGAKSSISNVTVSGSGRYELAYTVTGKKGDVSFRFSFVHPAPGATQNLGTATGLPPGLVDLGHPELAAREGYVGSSACGKCHGDLFTSWSGTLHNFAARTWDRAGLLGVAFVNDANDNGADDFKDGLDLATVPAFAAYGVNAPKLSFVAGDAFPYKIRIGAVTYDVERVMGGNGIWRQRYLVRIGKSLYASPVQFNEAADAYAAHDPLDWYTPAKAPRYAVATDVQKDLSFEARCSGCHNTGATVGVDAGTGEFVTGYVEFNIGCEQCHGPGADHAKQGDKSKIRNPASLKDGTKAGAQKANDVCGRCHQLGDAIDPIPGSTFKPGFGFSAAHGISQAFDDPAQFLVRTTSPADFWGWKANPFPAIPGATFLAGRSQPLEAREIAMSGHAPNAAGTAPVCFDCHDPHSRRQAYMIAPNTGDPAVPTAANDNTLCLSCHAGSGDFLAVSKIDVAAISAGPAPVSVVRAVVDHMKDTAGMPVTDAKYDPTGTSVGRCVTCHMPRMATASQATADKAGHEAGDLFSHTFEPVWPNASVLYGVTNSCNVCHPTTANDPVKDIITQWATTGADGDDTFHADTPSSFQNGTANAGSPGGGARCAACHTTAGFVAIQVKGQTLTQAEIDGIVKESIARDVGITCAACHGRNSSGAFSTGANPLRFPKKDLCGRCHNGQTVVYSDFEARGEMIRHPQSEMYKGTAGAEPPGSGPYSNSAHSSFSDACVACHYDKANHVESHVFDPHVATCTACHPGLTTFDRTARADYDGDGILEGIQTEMQGLLDALKGALLLDVRVTFSAATGYFDYGGATDHRMTGATAAQKRAVYNWYSETFDGSGGIHNTARPVRLLQQSYKELTGTDVPGAVLR